MIEFKKQKPILFLLYLSSDNFNRSNHSFFETITYKENFNAIDNRPFLIICVAGNL